MGMLWRMRDARCPGFAPFLLREMASISKEEFQYMLGCLPNLVGAPGDPRGAEQFLRLSALDSW